MDMKAKAICAAVAVLALGGSFAAPETDLSELDGVALWGCRKPHPVVVNPVVGPDAGDVLSLCGEWDFTTFGQEGRQELPLRNGIWGRFFADNWRHARKIAVPSCWEAQGVGEPGQGEGWDPHWDNSEKPIRHKYFGMGWYRKVVTVPSEWKGKRIWFKVGGVKSVAWIWVNERQVAHVANFCATEKYEITDLVEPGKPATVVISVDNRVPSRKGEVSEINKWGGIYRGIELEATPQSYIDDVWIRGDFDAKSAEAHVELGGVGAAEGLKVRLTVDGDRTEAPARDGEVVVRLPLGDFRPWSPERPNLCTAVVELVSGETVLQTRRERFGVRKLEVCGKEFRLNGKPYYFRGFGDDSVYPETGMPPADRDIHRRHLAIARAAGFNFVRLHTHCEVPEYFEAADEMGIIVQVELPYYSDCPAESVTFDPKRDVTELWRNFRRHPSFGVYSMGNEGSFGPDLDKALHGYVKAMDPDRLKINQDCHEARINPPESSDYAGGPITIWNRGAVNPDRPFVTHEYMNLGIKLDARTEGDFTGVWEVPNTLAARDKWLAGFGLDRDWGDRLQTAQNGLQKIWQKRGIECARTDPYCDGYIFWTIVDVVVWNDAVKTYSGQGLFTPHWKQKIGGASADDFAVFNGPTGLFADWPEDRRVFVSGERVKVDLLYANYGETPIADGSVTWSLAAKGRTLAAGRVSAGEQAVGAVRKIGTAEIEIPALAEPTRAELRLGLASSGTSNAYPVWLFPKRAVRREPKVAIDDSLVEALKDRYADVLPAARAAEATVVIAPFGSPLAEDAAKRGQRTIQLDGCGGQPNVKLGWWWMGSQVGMALREHPVFGTFPHGGVLDELLFRIVKKGRRLPVSGVEKDGLYAVGEGGSDCYLYLGERKADKALLVFGLDVLSDTPEGAALLDALIDYCKANR